MLHQNDEELLADESFINYCLERNEADMHAWMQIVRDNPETAARIEELRTLVILAGKGLQNIELKNQMAKLGRRIELAEEAVASAKPVSITRSVNRKLIAAAACFLLIAATTTYYFVRSGKSPASYRSSYITQPAEKKSLVLSDGTKVILNADSKLSIAPGFGQEERRVQLDGEAFFDVAHNASKPFVVHTARMDVKVLGTAFNVKAYATDDLFETALIRGSVELSLKKEKKTVMLRPNEKYVLREIRPGVALAEESITGRKTHSEGLLPVKIDKVDTSIVEVSWTENKIAFADEPFAQVVKKLERWYGVSIIVDDDVLPGNLYTGSFRNESIEDVLSALQFSRPFTYKKENDVIRISK
ncbi:FecR family protein [Agriterribacter sp.]|uniref:FecR family protein n=1 Tax=Agriterribacter sp. TaxID=2821509 RepID=UPI002CBA315F|nr:FecR domain-containing protein [Agriterribacter sp.]HTN05482.1 FecR domain-containing protein [Agriterribacter sp.]